MWRPCKRTAFLYFSSSNRSSQPSSVHSSFRSFRAIPGNVSAKKQICPQAHPASGRKDDLGLKMEPVGRNCPKCQTPIMVVHGRPPLLLLSCACQDKFVVNCSAAVVEAWPKAPRKKKRTSDDDDDDSDELPAPIDPKLATLLRRH
jgi:hypothetical protein